MQRAKRRPGTPCHRPGCRARRRQSLGRCCGQSRIRRGPRCRRRVNNLYDKIVGGRAAGRIVHPEGQVVRADGGGDAGEDVACKVNAIPTAVAVRPHHLTERAVRGSAVGIDGLLPRAALGVQRHNRATHGEADEHAHRHRAVGQVRDRVGVLSAVQLMDVALYSLPQRVVVPSSRSAHTGPSTRFQLFRATTGVTAWVPEGRSTIVITCRSCGIVTFPRCEASTPTRSSPRCRW